MAISNLASGLRTGVCTSTTRPTAPYNGQVIYETDSKQTLVWQGSAWVMLTDADTPPGMVLIASASFSGITTGAPLDVNSVFSSDFTNYCLHLRVSATVATADVRLRMRTVSAQEAGAIYNHGWGGAWVSGGPTYNWGAYYMTNPFAPETSWFAGMFPAAGYSGTSRLEIYSPNVARATRLTGQSYTDYTGVYNTALHGAGEVSTTTQYTGFRIFPIAGTIAGEYVLYGYRNQS